MSFCVSTGRMWWEPSLLTFATEFTVRKWLQSLPSWILLKIIISASLSLSWLIWCWEKDGQKKENSGCLWVVAENIPPGYPLNSQFLTKWWAKCISEKCFRLRFYLFLGNHRARVQTLHLLAGTAIAELISHCLHSLYHTRMNFRC